MLEARLNHALFLYRQQWAPRILTTGGAGGDPTFTEGEVGRAYLSSHGIPSEAILTETQGSSTVESTVAAAEIGDDQADRTLLRSNMTFCPPSS